MSDVHVRVRVLGAADPLPPAFEALFADGPSADLVHTREWLDNFRHHWIPPGDRFRLYAIEASPGGEPLALLPAVYSRLYPLHPKARVIHFQQPEGVLYRPYLRRGGPPPWGAFESVLDALRADPRPYDVLRASPLEPGAPFTNEVIAVLRRHRHPLQLYQLSDDCFAPTAGQSYTDYLATRGPAQRAAIDRAALQLGTGRRVGFRLFASPDELDAGWNAYLDVATAAVTEPDLVPPDFLRGLVRLAARRGELRLGVLEVDDVKAAAQIWIASAGVAHCLRIWSLTHDPPLPLDDVLTLRMVRHLLDDDRANELDFGAVSDEFAVVWAPERRRRIGLAAFNPRTWRGIKGGIRHVGASRLLALPRRVVRRLRGR